MKGIIDRLIYVFNHHLISISCTKRELKVKVPHTLVSALLDYLIENKDTQFKLITDITAVDHPAREKRFTLVYNLLSISNNVRIRVECDVDELTPIDSVSFFYSGANWYEREVWDMYGIYFDWHPDLRRILTDYGFQGFPLRKDFPLTGYVELRYDDGCKRIVAEEVEMVQEFRDYNISSVWDPVVTDYVTRNKEL